MNFVLVPEIGFLSIVIHSGLGCWISKIRYTDLLAFVSLCGKKSCF